MNNRWVPIVLVAVGFAAGGAVGVAVASWRHKVPVCPPPVKVVDSAELAAAKVAEEQAAKEAAAAKAEADRLAAEVSARRQTIQRLMDERIQAVDSTETAAELEKMGLESLRRAVARKAATEANPW